MYKRQGRNYKRYDLAFLIDESIVCVGVIAL